MRSLTFLLIHLLLAALCMLTGCGVMKQGVLSGKSSKEALKNSLAMELANGRNLERAGKWEKAREVYEKLIKEYPGEAGPYHRLGVVADQQKRHTEAQRLLSEAIRLAPQDAEMFNDLGYCFYLQGKLPKAESALLKAVHLAPDEGRFRNNLGLVLGHQQRYDEAFRQFAAAGSEADAFYNLAFIHASQRQDQQAMHCFELALASDPSHEAARTALDSFRRHDGPAAAEELLAAASGVRYVPFQENGDSGVLQAGHTSQISSGAPSLREARAATRELHSHARDMLDRNMSSAREKLGE